MKKYFYVALVALASATMFVFVNKKEYRVAMTSRLTVQPMPETHGLLLRNNLTLLW